MSDQQGQEEADQKTDQPSADPQMAISHFAASLGYPEGPHGVPERTALLMQALTHKSFTHEHRDSPPHNERLEFLGDAVLGLVVGHALMVAHPNVREGELSRMRAGLVNARRLAEEAGRIGLGAVMRLGRGEAMTGGDRKRSILADAFEAVIGAVYLDLGMEAARALIMAGLGPHIEAGRVQVADRDFKTAVQELVQSRFGETPRYRLVKSEGPDHEKVFTVALWVGGEEIAQGEGRSKKNAERAAAQAAWARLQTEE
ncbi:MAG: ribonuclease III [Bradymonadia bacterium]